MANSGVYPVYDNVFKIGTKGRASTAPGDMVQIAEMVNFSITVDGGVEEWNPLEGRGWVNRMVTSKSVTISVSGKLCQSDPGNAYVAGLAWKSGTDCDSKFEWDFPNGDKLAFDCAVNVTAIGGGDGTGIATLEFDIMSRGTPTYTPASEG